MCADVGKRSKAIVLWALKRLSKKGSPDRALKECGLHSRMHRSKHVGYVFSMPEVAGDAALLADPYSVASISEQMLRLWNEKGLREQLIEKVKIQRQKYFWDLTAEKMWVSMEKVLK